MILSLSSSVNNIVIDFTNKELWYNWSWQSKYTPPRCKDEKDKHIIVNDHRLIYTMCDGFMENGFTLVTEEYLKGKNNDIK